MEAPELEQDYIDLAFAMIIKKMKKTLNENEIMDAVEEVGGISTGTKQVVLKISLRYCNQSAQTNRWE